MAKKLQDVINGRPLWVINFIKKLKFNSIILGTRELGGINLKFSASLVYQ